MGSRRLLDVSAATWTEALEGHGRLPVLQTETAGRVLQTAWWTLPPLLAMRPRGS